MGWQVDQITEVATGHSSRGLLFLSSEVHREVIGVNSRGPLCLLRGFHNHMAGGPKQ